MQVRMLGKRNPNKEGNNKEQRLVKWKRREYGQKRFKIRKIVKSLMNLMKTRINDISNGKGIINSEEEIENQKNTVNCYMLINLSELDNFLVKCK